MKVVGPSRTPGDVAEGHRDSSAVVTALRAVDQETEQVAVDAVSKALASGIQEQLAPFTRHTDALLVDMKAEENRLHEAIAKIDAEIAKAQAILDEQIRTLTEAHDRRKAELTAEREDALFAFSGITAMREKLKRP
jgi:hypothetical protein